MKKLTMLTLILIMLVFITLQGCIANYAGVSYETSNTVMIDTRIDEKKQTFSLFLSIRDNKEFQKITKDIVKIFESWNSNSKKTGTLATVHEL